MSAEPKKKQTTLILAALLYIIGLGGIHRIYTGHTMIGIVQLLTAGGCGFWQLWDLIQIFQGKFLDANGNPLES